MRPARKDKALRRRTSNQSQRSRSPQTHEEQQVEVVGKEYYEESETSELSSTEDDEEEEEKSRKAEGESEQMEVKKTKLEERSLNKALEGFAYEAVIVDEEKCEGDDEEEEIIIIEGDSDEEGSDFERRVRKKVLKHLRKQQEMDASEAKKKQKAKGNAKKNKKDEEEEKKIQWDLEWEAIKNTVWSAVGFFVPPVVSYPVMFLLRILVVWPVYLSCRTAAFSHRVFTKTWPLILDFLTNFIQFPHRLMFRILEFSEGFAYRTFEHFHRIKNKGWDLSFWTYSSIRGVVFFVGGAFWRLLKKGKKKGKKLLKKGRRCMMALFDSSYAGVIHILYLLILPLRVCILCVKSFAWAGSITFASFLAIPSKVAHFIVHSPHIFGRSGKRIVRFIKANRQDIVDVCIALVFLTILGMILSGVFFPLLINILKGMVGFLAHMRTMFSRLRLPKLRIPRLNLAKLREVLPDLPFAFPALPIPDIALLLGLRERTFMEKVAYVFT